MNTTIDDLRQLIQETLNEFSTGMSVSDHPQEEPDLSDLGLIDEKIQIAERLLDEIQADVIEQKVSPQAADLLVKAKEIIINLRELISSDHPEIAELPYDTE
tara:strand:+ start:2867 stop:3172 length:306 start_codon:yes stop_codon:yes gene_type:complete